MGKQSGLALQDIVTGLAQIKGTRDIMSSITYFFELYDDDGDGKVDREGILRISEALLFISRRGFASLERSVPTIDTPQKAEESMNGPQSAATNPKKDELFLGSVSSFIRRCFEYADPDHSQNRAADVKGDIENIESDVGAFSIGEDEDEDEDFLDLATDPANPWQSAKPVMDANSRTISSTGQKSKTAHNSGGIQRRPSKKEAESANIALDPANPLHITLPTFRMVILADELLEQFFESLFPASFRLSGTPLSSNDVTPSPSLTTFASLNSPQSTNSSSLPIRGAAASMPPGRGLRGVLDNIVSDGMRVAAEVKRRMDEAQAEMERNALARDYEEEEDEGEGVAEYGGEADRRSVKSIDRDLLQGAEAEVDSPHDKIEVESPAKPLIDQKDGSA